ncbi:primase 1D-like protein [Burkholderia paludis]
MKSVNLDRHPVSLVPLWCAAVGEGWDAHFSRYTYVPQSIDDHRTPIQVPLAQVTPAWLGDQLSQLAPGEELAMHSTLTRGRRIKHIPMVDFAVKSGPVTEVAKWATSHLGIDLQFFDSGRSFHAYGTLPISKTQWVRLMGLLLLGNAPNRKPVVDSRWIGHRLLAGYSTLRWSKNTAHYTRWPTLARSTV